jgi:hypothetical protein
VSVTGKGKGSRKTSTYNLHLILFFFKNIYEFHKKNPNPRLDILVENKGRCCGNSPNFECSFKGTKNKPRLGLKELGNWTITKLSMDNKLTNQSTTFYWRSILSNISIVSTYI